jgi:hypothetical protein
MPHPSHFSRFNHPHYIYWVRTTVQYYHHLGLTMTAILSVYFPVQLIINSNHCT